MSPAVCTLVTPIEEPSRAGFTISGNFNVSITCNQLLSGVSMQNFGVGIPAARQINFVRHLSIDNAEPITPEPV